MKAKLIDHKNLIKEWHPTKNYNLRPEEISSGSEKKLWWLCSKGHSWQASPNSRTRNYYSNTKKKELRAQAAHTALTKRFVEIIILNFYILKLQKSGTQLKMVK